MKLEIGYKSKFEIRRYDIHNADLKGLKIVFLSDFHFNGFSQVICTKLIKRIQEIKPDLILLGGDCVDTKNGFKYFEQFIQAVKQFKVYAIAGNHDYFFGMERIESILEENNVCWIEKASIDLEINDVNIQIDGNSLESRRAGNQYQICVLHKPLKPDLVSEYDLVFAGHLHGGQFVLWQKDQALYPGKIFYPMNILEHRSKNCNYFITKGLGDTLPLRYNCMKDFILITFKSTI